MERYDPFFSSDDVGFLIVSHFLKTYEGKDQTMGMSGHMGNIGPVQWADAWQSLSPEGAKTWREVNSLQYLELTWTDTSWHTHTYIYILNILSSRQNPLHLSSYYFHLFSVIACWVAISFSSILCHYRFWRGHYRFTVFRAHLWQKCFCNTRVVFNDFDSNSYNIYICISLCACVII